MSQCGTLLDLKHMSLVGVEGYPVLQMWRTPQPRTCRAERLAAPQLASESCVLHGAALVGMSGQSTMGTHLPTEPSQQQMGHPDAADTARKGAQTATRRERLA